MPAQLNVWQNTDLHWQSQRHQTLCWCCLSVCAHQAWSWWLQELVLVLSLLGALGFPSEALVSPMSSLCI